MPQYCAIPAAPEPTPAQGINERGLGDVKSYVKSLISDVGSDISSFVDSGILDFPNGFPTGPGQERVHGNVYKIPDIEQKKVDDLANIFLIGPSVVQQGNENVAMKFVDDVTIVRPNAAGDAVNAREGGAQTMKLPYSTMVEGNFDAFTSQIQTLNMYAEGTDSGNATAYLVPPKGVTVISDFDDILRVTKIY
ncbi:Uncharacterized protein TPAR_08073 [Tolypocladium paradoxum]|uniref:Uncharacterized protein n=1 Tax=Tolypocladium paradoxum TaxID=94208 RepID=A0A2S4KNE9_9HYPO|nr:Uncharacterized protein TPAR_08073 [Tolypocladium paradoxum]